MKYFGNFNTFKVIPGTDKFRFNYWGYSTVNFLSPMSRYSAANIKGEEGQNVLKEFKEMIKECHKRGIEVILDVVYNHTAEGNHLGPSLSFRYFNYCFCINCFKNIKYIKPFIFLC